MASIQDAQEQAKDIIERRIILDHVIYPEGYNLENLPLLDRAHTNCAFIVNGKHVIIPLPIYAEALISAKLKLDPRNYGYIAR